MCNFCSGGLINQNNSITTCQYCLTEDRVIEAIKLAVYTIEDLGGDSDDLRAILEFLPDYPVVAVMEAEIRNVNKYIVEIIKNTFHVLSLKE